MILHSAILVELRPVTDRQTDRHGAVAYTALAQRRVLETMTDASFVHLCLQCFDTVGDHAAVTLALQTHGRFADLL